MIELPEGATPYDALEHWPLRLGSQHAPIHIYAPRTRGRCAVRTLALLEQAWHALLGLGFRPPWSPRQRREIDVFLWPGRVACYAEAVGEIASTPWNDVRCYLVLDPDGPYGGAQLRHTVYHELCHAFHGADDWYEYRAAYEGSATFVEWHAAGLDDALIKVLSDFQRHPDRSLEYDDGEQSWASYGYAMYLRFLQQRYAGGSPAFLAAAWQRARSGDTDGDDPNEPDLLDGLAAVLPGFEHVPSVIEFARWRFHTGADTRAPHDPDAARIPAPACRRLRLDGRSPWRIALDPAPMRLGACYVRARMPAGLRSIEARVLAPHDPETGWVLLPLADTRPEQPNRLVPGRPVRLQPPNPGELCLAVLALGDGVRPFDPDTISGRRFPATLELRAVAH